MDACDQYFELLELSPEASLEDIRRRYRYLKTLYGGEGIEIRALHDDCSEELRADFLARLEQAFSVLNALSDKNKAVAASVPRQELSPELREWVAQVARFDGPSLKEVRERLQVELKSMFSTTRIQPHFLEAIEAEAFEVFPAEVYLRSYLIEYSRFLGLDSRRVVEEYLPRYRAWSATRLDQGS